MNNTILVVDDNKTVRENISEILELANYDVLNAVNGKEALALARQHHPDLILCDIAMPQLDGYGVLHALQNNPKLSSIPFVFITAEVKKNDFRKAMDIGADDYLEKPFTGDELLKVVDIHLKRNTMIKKSITGNLEGVTDFKKQLKSFNAKEILAGSQVIKKYKKKDYVFHEGEEAKSLFLVVSGRIKVFKTNDFGKDYITDIFKEGDFFGYLALLDATVQKETAMAMEESQVALISKQDFFGMLHSNSEVSDSFIKMLSEHLEMAEEKLLTMAYDSARKKVAEALVFVAEKSLAEGKNEVSFVMSRENISALSGISPESVSRNLADLCSEGLIKIKERNITIPNLSKLQNLKW